MNLSNLLTLVRVAIIPIIVFCIYLKNPFFGWTAFILFCLVSITDYLNASAWRRGQLDRRIKLINSLCRKYGCNMLPASFGNIIRSKEDVRLIF